MLVFVLASLCNLEPATLTVPVNCPVVANNRHGNPAPDIWVVRDGVEIEIRPADPKAYYGELSVDYSNVCDGETVTEEHLEKYATFVLDLPGVQIGDELHVSTQQQVGIIVGEGPCPQPSAPWCDDSLKIDCAAYKDEAGGCNAGGSPSALALTSLGGLLWRRRCSSRQRARSRRPCPSTDLRPR